MKKNKVKPIKEFFKDKKNIQRKLKIRKMLKNSKKSRKK